MSSSTRQAVADRVPVDQIQAAFEKRRRDDEYYAAKVAREAGWVAADKGRPEKPDSTRVLRTMGLRARERNGGRLVFNRSMSYENAVVLVRAMGLDPVDFDV